jgi:hypothetical protein
MTPGQRDISLYAHGLTRRITTPNDGYRVEF